MNRMSWIVVIAILGWLLCAMYALGYSCGQKEQLRQLANPNITAYGSKRFNVEEFKRDMEAAGYNAREITVNGETKRIWEKE